MTDKGQKRGNTLLGVMKMLRCVFMHTNMSDNEYKQFATDIQEHFKTNIEIPVRN